MSQVCEAVAVMDYARKYIEKGFSICRLRPDEKKPTYPKWNLKSLKAEDFNVNDNIGIIAGTLSEDLVCVDLDSANALRQADNFLPQTSMVEGRPGKPRSHRWYRVTNIPPEMTSQTTKLGVGGPWLKHFRHAETNENLIDFIGTGGQAAVPPSLHASGERRVWHHDGEPASVPMVELWDAVCKLAAACGWKLEEKSVRRRKERRKGGYHPTPHGKLRPRRERIEQGKRFVDQADLAVSGYGGHDKTFRVARYLRNDLALPKVVGRKLLDRYNERLEEAWSDAELDHKWDSAGADNPEYPYGCKATAESKGPINDPHRLARLFMEKSPWVFWNGSYFRYEVTKYREVPERELRAILNSHIKHQFDADHAKQVVRHKEAAHQHEASGGPAPRRPHVLSVSRTIVSDTQQALESMALRPGGTSMPGWLANDRGPNQLGLINGLLDLGSGQLHPHTADWFSTVGLPYPYSAEVRSERWLAMLKQNLEGDAERIALLQEFFGYCLINSTDAQACLMLVGEGCNGKSVVLAGLHAMLGVDNVSTVPLEEFGKRFAMVQTLGKLANICPEIGELDKTDEGTLKAFVSGDRMTFERKGKDTFTARPTARLVLATNNFPRFTDRSEGVWRRLIVIPFNRRVPEQERVYGMDKAEWWLNAGEGPGLLNWALEGLKRLRANNMRFTTSSVCRYALEANRLESDPCRTFLLEHFKAVPEAGPLPVKEVYDAYRAWCEQNGYKAPLTGQAFGKQVRRVFGLEESRTHRFALLGPQRAWFGLTRLVTNVTECNAFGPPSVTS